MGKFTQTVLNGPPGFSGDLADYTEDAKTLDERSPSPHVLRQADGWTTADRSWLKKNMPNSRAIAFGSHLMFWRFPDTFNSAVNLYRKASLGTPGASGGPAGSARVGSSDRRRVAGALG